jgi:hypothetical protein
MSGFLITTRLLRSESGNSLDPLLFRGSTPNECYGSTPHLLRRAWASVISAPFSQHLAAVYEGMVASLLYVTNIWSATGHETIFLDVTGQVSGLLLGPGYSRWKMLD